MKRISGGRGTVSVALVLVSALGLGLPARADDTPLTDSCKPHPVQVVNPGCAPALVDGVTTPVLDPPQTYPDLFPDTRAIYAGRPLVGIDRETFELTYGPPELAFDTWVQNMGTVNLDLLTDEPTNNTDPTVSQCVVWAAEVCRERRPVGGFEVHPGHNHFHFNEFARFELRSVLADGIADYSEAGLLALSDKVSFCLVDSAKIRAEARPAPAYVACTGAREGVSAGWADIYSADLDGQQLSPPGGLTDGRYALVINVDYANRIFETDNSNNVVEVIVDVSGNATRAEVVSRRWP